MVRKSKYFDIIILDQDLSHDENLTAEYYIEYLNCQSFLYFDPKELLNFRLSSL